MLKLQPQPGVAAKPGSFGASVRPGALLVPAPVGDVLLRNRITTAEKLVALAGDLPGSVAAMLGWSIDDVARARSGLMKLLRGHVDPDLLEEPNRGPQRGFGALPPLAKR